MVVRRVVRDVDGGKCDLVLKVLADREFLYGSLPFVVGREGDRVRLGFFEAVVWL